MPLLGWLILAFLIALILAAIHGVKSGYRSIRSRYRAKRDLARAFAATGVAPRAATKGKRVGMAIGATVTGPGVTWRSFLDGVRRGWRVGKRWTEIQRTRRQREREAAAAGSPPPAAPPPVAPLPAPATTAAPTPATPATPAAPTAPPPSTPAPTPSTTKGTTTVPIETKTSGELHNKEQFEQELNATIAEATAELEAANADLKAAAEDVGRVDNMVASLARCEIDVATRGDVMTLAGTNSTTQAAHRSRVTAAEQRLAAANKALVTFKNAAQTKFHANAS